MLRIDNVSSYGWAEAIRGMRNPLNSWEKSDSELSLFQGHVIDVTLGDNDLDLMKRLVRAGSADRKFMRMITVYVDVTAPLYWWKEFDTYKVGTVRNSCSTMHKIMSKEFKYRFSMCCREHFKKEKFTKCGNQIVIANDSKKRKYSLGAQNDWEIELNNDHGL